MALYSLLTWLPLFLTPLVLYLKKHCTHRKPKGNLPRGPPKLPILGNLHQLGHLAHQTYSQFSKTYGPVVFLKLGCISSVVVHSAEAAKQVLKTHDIDCCSRPALTGSGKLSYNYLDLAFSPYGEVLKEIRKICVPEVFSLKRVASFRFIREEEVGLQMNSVSESASCATPVDLSEKMYALTGSIIFRMAFGQRFQGSGVDNKQFAQLVHDTEEILGNFSAKECIPFIGWLIDMINGYNRNVERVFRNLDALFQKVIDNHLEKRDLKQEQEGVIDVLLRIEREQNEVGTAWLTKNHMKAVMLNMFLGGIDTTAITLVWAMAELIKRPMVMKKVQDEVRNCVGTKGRVTEDDLNQLEYLKMVIKETLRLHPPVPLLLLREAKSHFKINDFDIYPKTLIQVNAWAIGRDPKYWTNPEEFSPERFYDNPIDYKGQNFEYLPFGAGRRMCPGVNMGICTVEIALANLLYCFDWKLPQGMKEKDVNMDEAVGISLTLHKKTVLELVATKYLP